MNEHGPTIQLTCQNCNNRSWFNFLSYRTWFTLFFIPIIPYESKNLLLCPVCTHGFELNGEQVEKAKHLNTLARAFLAEEIEEPVYLEALRDANYLE